MIIHALAIADQSAHPVATTTAIIRVREVAQAVATVAVVVAVRVALDHAKEIVQVAVVDVPVNSYFNRPCGMRCYK